MLREQLDEQHAAFLNNKDSVKRECDEKRERAEHELDALFNDLRALAACAVSTRTGRTMETEEVETQLNALKRKEEDVAQLRLQYIKLKNRYTKEDEALRSKVRPTITKDSVKGRLEIVEYLFICVIKLIIYFVGGTGGRFTHDRFRTAKN